MNKFLLTVVARWYWKGIWSLTVVQSMYKV